MEFKKKFWFYSAILITVIILSVSIDVEDIGDLLSVNTIPTNNLITLTHNLRSGT